MSNLIDAMTAYFDRKGDTFGQWYTRCLMGFLYLWCALGFVAGLLFGASHHTISCGAAP